MNETAYQGQYGQTPEDALRQARAELEERDEQLGILHAVMQTVSSSFDLPTMFNNASQAASHIFRGASIFVGLINAAETEISIFSNFSAKTDDPEIAGMRFPLTHGSQLGDMLFRKQIPVMIPDAETDPIFAHLWPLVRQYAPKTLLLIPLVHHNVLGIFGIYTIQMRRNFTLNEVILGTTIAGQIAGSIYHVRLFENERKQRQRAETLQEISIILNSSLNQDIVLRKILEQVRRVLPYDAAGIFLRDGDDLVLSFGMRVNPVFFGKRIALRSPSYEAQVFTSRQPVMLTDAAQDPRWNVWEYPPIVRGWIAAPMFVGDHGIGVLTVDSYTPSAYQQDDARILQVVANHAATAIHNAQLYQQLAHEKQFFETLMINSPVATILVDAEMRVMSWNPSAERLFGYLAAETIGNNLDALIAWQSGYDEAAAYSKQIGQGQIVRAITQRNRKNGQRVDVELWAAPVLLEHAAAAYLVIYHDITELEQARKNAEAAIRAKNAFLANMSHELRTPLTAILGFSELLLHRQAVPEHERVALDSVYRNGEYLLLLLNNLLDLARLESGQGDWVEREVNLFQMLNEFAQQLAARYGRARLTWHRHRRLPEYIRTDEVKVHQVLMHLLTDLLKTNEDGRLDVRVHALTGANETAERRLCFHIHARSETPGGALNHHLLPISREFVRLIRGELTVWPPKEKRKIRSRILIQIPVKLSEHQETFAAWQPHDEQAFISFEQAQFRQPEHYASRLDALPAELLQKIAYAAVTAEISTMWDMQERVRAFDAELADMLTYLGENFEYGKILAMVEPILRRKDESESTCAEDRSASLP